MRRSRLIAAAFAVAMAIPLIGPATPAAAVDAPGSACNNTAGATISAVLSWYPGAPGQMSGYKAACVFRNDTGNNFVSPSYSLHDMTFAVWHNGSARHIAVNAAGAPGNTLTAQASFTGTGLAGWVNRTITGPGIAPRTHVVSVNDGTSTLTLNQNHLGGIVAGDVMVVENAEGARSVADATQPAADQITSVNATFNAGDAALGGHAISGTGIGPNAKIVSVAGNTATITAGKLPAGTLGGPEVTIGGPLNYRLGGGIYGPTGVTISSTRQVTTASANIGAATIDSNIASFKASDVGLRVRFQACDDGNPVPADQFITAINSATQVAIAPGGAGAARTCDLVIGEANGNAPDDGETVLNQGVQLDLSPSLVAGGDACANNTPEGFAVTGQWYSPGNFQGGSGAPNRQQGFGTAGGLAAQESKAIGQIFIETSAASYSMFVMERESGTLAPNGVTGSYPFGTDPIGAIHYDLMVPFAPTGLALCPGNADSPGLGFSTTIGANTNSQITTATGSGRPGTGQVRNTIARNASGAASGYNGTTYATSDAVAAQPQWTPTSNFSRLCAYPNSPAGTPHQINFACGAG